ncbi:MAG: PP2C family protein-serine/threonine phosphatase [bacterium]|nr:PP2C family protein-serine/threonine phosphatase [bacterium]
MPRSSLSLYHRIEDALETIALGSTPLNTVESTAQFLVDSFAQDLGIAGGRIYVKDNGSYKLVSTFGDLAGTAVGLRLDRTYPPFGQLLNVGSVVMKRDDERLDPRIESELGTRECFAAISVDDGGYVLSFDFDSRGESNEDLIATLNIIRLAINQQLRSERMMEILEEARLIQESILPRHLPRLQGYQIAARSIPAEIVGGDFYDVITQAEGSFHVVVADATGHGLPAALQVRDVFTGLRMGLSRELKLSRTLERLNKIIHRSRLSTKFVSLFLAELEPNGSVLYSNGGHPPAIMVRSDGDIEELRAGGMILGPMPNVTYSIGLVCMDIGDVLVLYTDGITEAMSPTTEEEFGEERLYKLVSDNRERRASTIVDRIFTAVHRFSDKTPPEDDQTVLVVIRRRRNTREQTI